MKLTKDMQLAVDVQDCTREQKDHVIALMGSTGINTIDIDSTHIDRLMYISMNACKDISCVGWGTSCSYYMCNNITIHSYSEFMREFNPYTGIKKFVISPIREHSRAEVYDLLQDLGYSIAFRSPEVKALYVHASPIGGAQVGWNAKPWGKNSTDDPDALHLTPEEFFAFKQPYSNALDESRIAWDCETASTPNYIAGADPYKKLDAYIQNNILHYWNGSTTVRICNIDKYMGTLYRYNLISPADYITKYEGFKFKNWGVTVSNNSVKIGCRELSKKGLQSFLVIANICKTHDVDPKDLGKWLYENKDKLGI